MSEPVTFSHEQKRPVLHELIDALPAEELELVERLLARLEMDRIWKDVREGFTQDWTEGNSCGWMRSSEKSGRI